MYREHNENPAGKRVGDCVIRAISTALVQDWGRTYVDLMVKGLEMADLPSANNVWGAYLRDSGWRRGAPPDTCPDCYNVRDFCADHPKGRFVLACPEHVVAVNNGDYYDTWDCGDIPVIYFWAFEGS